MNWKMRGLGVAGAVALACAMAGLPAFATTPVNGTGTLTNCHMSGKITFDPPVSSTTRVITTTINASITCSGGTGDGANIKTGTATATETKSENCSLLAGTTAQNMHVKATWVVKKGKRAINPSNGTLTKVTTAVNGSTDVITLNATGKVTSGSFSAAPKNDILAHAIIKESASLVMARCEDDSVTRLTIQPTSGFKIN